MTVNKSEDIKWTSGTTLQLSKPGARGGHALIPRRSDPESSLTEK